MSSFVAYEELVSLVGEFELVGHVEVALLVCVGCRRKILVLMLAEERIANDSKSNPGFSIGVC